MKGVIVMNATRRRHDYDESSRSERNAARRQSLISVGFGGATHTDPFAPLVSDDAIVHSHNAKYHIDANDTASLNIGFEDCNSDLLTYEGDDGGDSCSPRDEPTVSRVLDWERLYANVLNRDCWSRLLDLSKRLNQISEDVLSIMLRTEEAHGVRIDDAIRLRLYKMFSKKALGATDLRFDEVT